MRILKWFGSLPDSAHLFLAVVLALGLIVFSWTSCAVGKGQLNPSTHVYDTNAVGDTLVVTTENVRATALEVFDLFMQTEYTNREALKALNPAIHDAAERVRKEGKTWLDALTAAKVAYQSDRSVENAGKLNASLAFLNSMLANVNKYLAQARTVK